MATEKSNEFFPNSKRVYVSGSQNEDMRVPFREISLHPTQSFNGEMETNEPLRVYDTSGPWGDDVQSCDSEQGLTPLRADWIQARGDTEGYEGRDVQPQDNGYLTVVTNSTLAGVKKQKGRLEYFPGLGKKPLRAKAGGCVTQMHYARRGIVTPEMEFIAIRENLGRAEAYEALMGESAPRNHLNHQHPANLSVPLFPISLRPNLFVTRSHVDGQSSQRISTTLKPNR